MSEDHPLPIEPEAEPPVTQVEDLKLSHLSLIIIAGIFATTLAQPIVLGRLPITFLLKNQLHANATQISSFFFFGALAWYFKPFAGILTDAFPFFGTRRRHYMLTGSALAGVSWLALGMLPHTYLSLLIGAIVVNVFMVVVSTVTGAFLVEAGQRIGATGRLTALRQFVQNACQMIQGPLGGILAAGSFSVAAAANGAIALSVIPIVWLFLREKPVAEKNEHVLINAKEQLATVFRSKTLWMAILFVGLFYFAPGFSTPLVFRQTDVLKFSPQYIGLLGSFSGGFGILAAIVYGFLIKRFSLKTMIIVGVVTNALGTLLFLLYNGATSAALIDSQNGFFFTLAEISLMNLAAKATPRGCEGLGYSLILSMRNLAVQGADVMGSKLVDAKWEFSSLIYLNAGTTLIVLLLLPILPAKLLKSNDSDPVPGR